MHKDLIIKITCGDIFTLCALRATCKYYHAAISAYEKTHPNIIKRINNKEIDILLPYKITAFASDDKIMLFDTVDSKGRPNRKLYKDGKFRDVRSRDEIYEMYGKIFLVSEPYDVYYDLKICSVDHNYKIKRLKEYCYCPNFDDSLDLPFIFDEGRNRTYHFSRNMKFRMVKYKRKYQKNMGPFITEKRVAGFIVVMTNIFLIIFKDDKEIRRIKLIGARYIYSNPAMFITNEYILDKHMPRVFAYKGPANLHSIKNNIIVSSI